MKKYGHWWRHAKNIFTAYGVSWLWVLLVVNLLQALFANNALPANLPYLSVMYSWLTDVPWFKEVLAASPMLSLFLVLVFAPFIEEIIFRLPLTFFVGKKVEYQRVYVLAACGVIFGWLHGSPINVFIQGFTGMMLGWLFLKNYSSQWAAYISCVLVHFLYNLTVTLTAL